MGVFVKLNLSLVVAAPPNIDCCKYFIVFGQGEDDDDDDDYDTRMLITKVTLGY